MPFRWASARLRWEHMTREGRIDVMLRGGLTGIQATECVDDFDRAMTLLGELEMQDVLVKRGRSLTQPAVHVGPSPQPTANQPLADQVTTPVAASDATAGASGSRRKATRRRDSGCTSGVATAAAAIEAMQAPIVFQGASAASPIQAHLIEDIRFERGADDGTCGCCCGWHGRASEFAAHRKERGAPTGNVAKPIAYRQTNWNHNTKRATA